MGNCGSGERDFILDMIYSQIDPTEGKGLLELSCLLSFSLLRMFQSMSFTLSLVIASDKQMPSKNTTKFSVDFTRTLTIEIASFSPDFT